MIRYNVLFFGSILLLPAVLAAQQCADDPPGPCGDPLGPPYRGVVPRSNAPWQASQTGNSCGGQVLCTYGYHYQCPEYVRRFHATNDGPNVWNPANAWQRIRLAKDYFWKAGSLGLEAISNGDQRQPQPDDILVFDKATAIGDTIGHVAIVTTVSAMTVRVVEQNDSASGYKDLPRDLTHSGYYLSQRGSYPILGWLRKPASQNVYVIQPGPEGKDTAYGTVFATNGQPDSGTLYDGGWGDWYYDYFEFDLTGAPSAAQTAKAEFYVYANIAPNDPALQVMRITESWTEAGVTLANSPASVFYKNFGPLSAGWNAVDITDLYRGWKNGTYPNFGIKLAPTQNDQTNGSLASSDNPDPAIRPKLVITHN